MLILDGSETLATLFAEMFEKRGWEVVVCGQVDCAMEQLGGHKSYQVILVGDRVIGANGVEFVRLIRLLEHRRRAAVVMVSGAGDASDAEALGAGADEVLRKPVNPHALVWAVEKHVS